MSVLSDNLPIHLKLTETKEMSEKAQGNLNNTNKEINDRTLEMWQLEWETAETGRHAHNLFTSVGARQSLSHLQDLDHGAIQLLIGYGSYKKYLKRFLLNDGKGHQFAGKLMTLSIQYYFVQPMKTSVQNCTRRQQKSGVSPEI